MAGATGLLFELTETGNPIDLRLNVKRKANARLHGRVGAYLRNHQDEVVPDIVFCCCRSKGVVNTPFPLQEAADILTELLEETNMVMHRADLYTEVHSQLQDYIRIQRFSLVPLFVGPISHSNLDCIEEECWLASTSCILHVIAKR